MERATLYIDKSESLAVNISHRHVLFYFVRSGNSIKNTVNTPCF